MSDDDQGGPVDPDAPTPEQLAEIEVLLGSIVREFKSRSAETKTTEVAPEGGAEVFDLAKERRKRALARGEAPPDLQTALDEIFTRVFGAPMPYHLAGEEVLLNEEYLRQHAPEILAGALRNLADAMDTAAKKKGVPKKPKINSASTQRGPVKFRVDLGSLISRLFGPKN